MRYKNQTARKNLKPKINWGHNMNIWAEQALEKQISQYTTKWQVFFG